MIFTAFLPLVAAYDECVFHSDGCESGDPVLLQLRSRVEAETDYADHVNYFHGVEDHARDGCVANSDPKGRVAYQLSVSKGCDPAFASSGVAEVCLKGQTFKVVKSWRTGSGFSVNLEKPGVPEEKGMLPPSERYPRGRYGVVKYFYKKGDPVFAGNCNMMMAPDPMAGMCHNPDCVTNSNPLTRVSYQLSVTKGCGSGFKPSQICLNGETFAVTTSWRTGSGFSVNLEKPGVPSPTFYKPGDSVCEGPCGLGFADPVHTCVTNSNPAGRVAYQLSIAKECDAAFGLRTHKGVAEICLNGQTFKVEKSWRTGSGFSVNLAKPGVPHKRGMLPPSTRYPKGRYGIVSYFYTKGDPVFVGACP